MVVGFSVFWLMFVVMLYGVLFYFGSVVVGVFGFVGVVGVLVVLIVGWLVDYYGFECVMCIGIGIVMVLFVLMVVVLLMLLYV